MNSDQLRFFDVGSLFDMITLSVALNISKDVNRSGEKTLHNIKAGIVGARLVKVYGRSEFTTAKPALSPCYIYLYPLTYKS